MAEPTVPLADESVAVLIFELYVNEADWRARKRTIHFKAAIETLLPRLCAA